jgi:hypothetical protein
MSAHTEQHDDVLALQEILALVERSVEQYNFMVAEVREHQDRIAKARAALRPLHTRLVGMRTALKGWENRVWEMWVRDVGPREVRENTKRRIAAHDRVLDDLVWELFEFREKSERGEP